MINNCQKFLNFLGIVERTGKIITGEDRLLTEIHQHRIRFLIIPSDTGRSTYHKFMNKVRYYQIPYNNYYRKSVLGHAIGMGRTILGISDKNFANYLIELNRKIKGQ